MVESGGTPRGGGGGGGVSGRGQASSLWRVVVEALCSFIAVVCRVKIYCSGRIRRDSKGGGGGYRVEVKLALSGEL